MSEFSWELYGHRLRVTRLALDISEAAAAAAHGVTVRTYRKWEHGGKQRGTQAFLDFTGRYDISLDWLAGGDTSRVGSHLSKRAKGKIAILPAQSARSRWVEQQNREYRAARDLPEPA